LTSASDPPSTLTVRVSAAGRIVLPAALRRRLGLVAGSRVTVVEEADGVRLRLVRCAPHAEVAKLAGMLKAPVRGVPRRLEDFDGARGHTTTKARSL
jgi:antitoxin PrlF